MSQVKSKPAHEIRLGTIKATIWRQEKDGFTRYNINFSRGYLSEGQWKISDSYGRDDLPRVIKCADLAYEWIFQQSSAGATDQESAPAEGSLAQKPRPSSGRGFHLHKFFKHVANLIIL